MAENNPLAQGTNIWLTSQTPIVFTFFRAIHQELIYKLQSRSPISLNFSNIGLNFSDPDTSSDELNMEVDNRNHPKRRRHSQEHEDIVNFWKDNFASLPESMTRIPKTDSLRSQQHVKMVDMLHMGKAQLVAAKAELELVKHQLGAKEEENGRIRGEKLELQIRCDMLERQLRGSPISDKQRSPDLGQDDGNVGASTSKGITHTAVKQEYDVPEGFDRNESIFNRMADTTLQRLDPSIVSAKKTVKPIPLMSLQIPRPENKSQRKRSTSRSPTNDQGQRGSNVTSPDTVPDNFWTMSSRGPFVLHTHSNRSNARRGRGGCTYAGGLGSGRGQPQMGTYQQRGVQQSPVRAGFVRAGVGHGFLGRRPIVGTGSIFGSNAGFRIQSPRQRIPNPTNIFSKPNTVVTSAPACYTATAPMSTSPSTTKDADPKSVSSAPASTSTSTNSTGSNKPKATRSTKKKKTSETETKMEESDSDNSVLRMEVSRSDMAFIEDRELTDYEDAV